MKHHQLSLLSKETAGLQVSRNRKALPRQLCRALSAPLGSESAQPLEWRFQKLSSPTCPVLQRITRVDAQHIHAEDSPTGGKAKTHVLSLFKTVTHECLPNLRHCAFPLAIASSGTTRGLDMLLIGFTGPVPGAKGEPLGIQSPHESHYVMQCW